MQFGKVWAPWHFIRHWSFQFSAKSIDGSSSRVSNLRRWSIVGWVKVINILTRIFWENLKNFGSKLFHETFTWKSFTWRRYLAIRLRVPKPLFSVLDASEKFLQILNVLTTLLSVSGFLGKWLNKWKKMASCPWGKGKRSSSTFLEAFTLWRLKMWNMACRKKFQVFSSAVLCSFTSRKKFVVHFNALYHERKEVGHK